jgi:galacturonosyltransferase
MKDKGADELLYAAKAIRKEYPYVVFRLIGGFDGAYEAKVQHAVEAGEIEYLGHQSDVHACLKEAHAIVHASYHEGMSNVLLEAAACARPIIATDVPGCRETYENGISGIACKACDGEDLARAIREFIVLPYEQKILMGQAGRQKAEQEFDRTIVIKQYLKEVAQIESRR